MKRLSRMLGVTLLEIMLVLAIAAMIIVMSIRYYQNATIAQQTNTIMQTVLAITVAADNLAQGTGTYSAASTTNIKNIVGSLNFLTPWSGGTNAFAISSGTSTYSVIISKLPSAVCTAIVAKLAIGKSGSHYTAGACTSSGNNSSVSYTYSGIAAP